MGFQPMNHGQDARATLTGRGFASTSIDYCEKKEEILDMLILGRFWRFCRGYRTVLTHLTRLHTVCGRYIAITTKGDARGHAGEGFSFAADILLKPTPKSADVFR